MERWTRELRQAGRRLTAAPAFAAAILLVVATSVGIAVAMSSLATATLEQAVPYPDADALVRLYEQNPSDGIDDMPPSLSSLRVWKERNRVFTGIGTTHAPLNLALATPEGGLRVLGGLASPELFDVLGVAPVVGRAFTADEGRMGRSGPTAILSHEFWTRQFGADPDLIGRDVILNDQAWTVVGVLPPGVPLMPALPESVDVWLPLGQAPVVLGRDPTDEPTFRAFPSVARLRPDATPERLAQELASLGAVIAETHPGTSQGWSWTTEPLDAAVTRDLRDPVRSLAVGAVLLLVVAVSNVVGLFLQRARDSAGSAAIRTALGAAVQDLRRAATAEALLLGIAGTGAGLVLAGLALANQERWTPFPLPPHVDVGLDARIAGASLALAALAAVVVGVVTAAWWWRHAERASLRDRRSGRDRGATVASRSVAAVQVALAAVLSVTAVLTLASIHRLTTADTGIRHTRLLTARVDVPAELRADHEVSSTATEIALALRSLPGVEAAALWSPHVPGQAVWHTGVRVLSRPDLHEDGTLQVVRIHQVGPGAGSLLGLRFVHGRDFTEDDVTGGRRVAIVSASAAEEWWGGADPVGRQIQRWNHDEASTVVGVVADAPLAGRQGQGADFFRDVFFLHDQDPQRFLVYLVRSRASEPGFPLSVTAAIRSAAPDLPVYDVRWMREILSDQERIARSTATLGVVFAATALVLVAVGLYGILANVVSHRTLEISLRKALGASPGRILREVTAPVWAVVAGGILVGVAVAWLTLPRLLGTVLYQVAPQSAGLYVVAVVVLVGVTVPAVMAPALRGSRRSPAESLREGAG